MSSTASPCNSYTDVYGVKRDLSTNRAILSHTERDAPPFFGGDALSMAEMTGYWKYRILNLPPARTQTERDQNGHDLPTSLFITTPNMSHIPDTLPDGFEVRVRRDGRYAHADFTLCPQWYFEGTYYLPYIRRRPLENLHNNEYRLAWYDLRVSDFVFETGSAFQYLGLIKKELADGFIAMRKKLAKKITDLEASGQFTRMEMRELIYAKEGMLFASVILTCAPQTYYITLLTITGFQRYFLEALACYEYLTEYRDTPYREFGDTKDPSDCIPPKFLMGCFTGHLDLAEKLYRKGVPVWLVRRPADIPKNIAIHGVRDARPIGVEEEFMTGAQPVFSGDASAVRNRACQALRLGNITLSHSAYIPNHGDFTAQVVPNFQVVQPYAAPFVPVSNNSSSSTQTSTSSSGPSSSESVWAPPSSGNLPPPGLQKLSKQISINPSKFLPCNSAYFPVANKTWVDALGSVNQDTSRIWDHSELWFLRGYPFPDPYLFQKGVEEDGRAKLELFCWLSLRPAWMMYSSADEQRTHPTHQDWKNFFHFTVAPLLQFTNPPSSTTSTPVGDEPASKRRRTSSKGRITFDVSNTDPNSFIQWKGVVLTSGGSKEKLHVPVDKRVIVEVIWDLVEHNFRFELLALDRAIHPRAYMSPPDALHRDTLVAACIPDSTFVTYHMPTYDYGLGAAAVKDRWEYVEALRILMLTWSGSAVGDLSRMKLCSPDEKKCLAVEAVAYPLYCQTFFDYFGRAATIPRQWPC